MLDYRIETFLKLCETMNYRKTAELLYITQPAVTQQIQFLEKEYGAKLFVYENRKLEKTREAEILERYAISMKYNVLSLKKEIENKDIFKLKVGVTKTIGDYVVGDIVKKFLKDDKNMISIVVENTENLLKMLEENQLDFAMVEGYFDKERYDYNLYRKESFVGICHKKHIFSNKEVELKDLLKETIIYREEGSGTRAILEQKLLEFNETLSHFKRNICISSLKLITDLVKVGTGISFVYDIVAEDDKDIAKFRIKNHPMIREFNFVYLKNTNAKSKIDIFLGI